MDFELSKYPINEQSQKNDIVVSVINFDNYFKEKIGHPFLILTKKFYPISAIRHYIEEQMGMKQHCHLKLVVNNRTDICELCGKYRCQESKTLFIQDALRRMRNIFQLSGQKRPHSLYLSGIAITITPSISQRNPSTTLKQKLTIYRLIP